LWRAFIISALCVLTSAAAFSCGDDDTDGGTGGSGAGSGGSGGSGGGGTAGKGGSGGKGGTAAPPPTTMECITQTTAIFKGQSGGLSAECISCTCGEDAAAIAACNADAANCWGLINCVDEYKCSGANLMTCAITNCSKFTAGAGPATTAGKVLQSDKCSAKCAPADTSDAGVGKDAGI
jgi:hypothetical protein